MNSKRLRAEQFVCPLAIFLILIGSRALAQSGAYPEQTRAATVFVGHSLINYDMPRMVEVMAASRAGMSLTGAVQVINGAPLAANWERCRRANFRGEYPPKDFACDSIERGSASGPYDSLIATDANNSIESNRIWNRTHEFLEQFMELLLSHNQSARTFLFTSWESWEFHEGRWLEAIESELTQYETIAREAERLSRARGRGGRVEVIPVNLALKNLVEAIQRSEVPGMTTRQQIFDDGVHMSPLGNYFVASVVFSALFNRSPEGVTTLIPGEYGGIFLQVSPSTAAALHRVAWQSISSYRMRSSSSVARPRPSPSGNVE